VWYVGKAAGLVTTALVKTEQNAVAPTPPSLFIARRQLSELQCVGRSAGVAAFVGVVLWLEEPVDVVVGDGLMELKLGVGFP
jgi:hypothetical protein